jgi:hypothetical protein
MSQVQETDFARRIRAALALLESFTTAEIEAMQVRVFGGEYHIDTWSRIEREMPREWLEHERSWVNEGIARSLVACLANDMGLFKTVTMEKPIEIHRAKVLVLVKKEPT